ncbi:MAG: S9 family peptidase, partial [Acidobacteria bacterium]|nr:S9 family peptidase [Acidobacteriota bacterium]
MAFLTAGRAQSNRHPITFDDLIGFGRVADPQPSPDGQWIAYSVTRYDKAKNAGNSDIWIIPTAGGEARQLTQSEKRDNNPRWSPDGKNIAFISSRDGLPQIWVIDLSGGEARKLTTISTGAAGVVWSPDGKLLAFTSEVFPDCKDDECNRKRTEAAETSKVKAKIIDRLLYRHWDSWKDGRRTHVFVVSAEGGIPLDVTPGDYDAPPFSLGGPTDYDFSPDGKEICFARNTDKVEAVSTNVDLWVVSTTGGEPVKLTPNPAYDGSPLYSPDGRFIAYRAQRRAGFESDKFELMVYDRNAKTSRSLTAALDRSVSAMDWTSDSQSLFFSAEDGGFSAVFHVSVRGGDARRVIENSFNDDIKISSDRRFLVFTRQSLSSPIEIYRADSDGRNAHPVTRVNESALQRVEMGEVQSVQYSGAGKSPVQAWLVKPPGFDPSKKWPAIVLIHGGPQSAWNDAFSYRWNMQMFASRGYVVFA